MNATIQETLLDLFHRMIDDPDRIPVVPTDAWPEDSEQGRLLTSLHDMLTLIQKSKQQAERQLREKEEQYRSLLAVSRHFEKALAEMREREAQYRSIFEAVTDGILIIDLEDGRLVEVNPRACELFGYTREEFLGRVMNLSDNTQEPPVFARDVVRAGGFFQLKDIAIGKDGKSFYAQTHASPFTYQGKPHMLVVNRDITEQMQAEQQLREREEQYRSIFEATSDGLIIRDMDGFVVEANPAACNMHGYAYEEFLGLHRRDIIDPKDHTMVAEYMKAIRAGHSFLGQAVDLRKDGTPFPVEVRGTTFTYQGKPHTLSVLRDITERVEAEKQLREKEAQYRAVFEASTDALVVLDPDGFYVEANPAMCSMFGYTDEELIGLHAGALTAQASLQVLTGAMEKIKVGEGFQVEGQGLRKDGTVFYAETHLTPFTYQGKPHLLASTRDITERIQAQQLLEQRVQERTRELSTLLEVSHNVASTLELKSLLGLILEQLKVVAEYDGATVTTVEGEHLVIIDYRGAGRENMLGWRFPLKQLGLIWETICRQEVVIVEDVHSDTPLALAYQQAVGDLHRTIFAPTRAWMAVPMMLKERVMGVLNLSSREPYAFTWRHAALALGIANQAAIAIENAQLYAQAQKLAAMEERQKLARELHDSVSQALYGISLGAHAARTALERDPEHVAEPLDYILSLAEAALAEMRALIFELRPESLETEGVVSALSKQAAALQARNAIAVATDLCDEPDLPLPVKEDLYRIAQEAMHNTVKHAHASHIDLRLDQTPGGITLEIRDDGAGFDTAASFPGHLGLHTMSERVTNLGGTFEIESAPGAGTRVCVSIPGRK